MTVNTEKIISLKVSREKRLKRLFIYSLLIFSCSLILWIEYYGYNKGSSKLLLGAVGLAWGISGSISTSIRLIKIADLSVDIGPEGIFDRRICNVVMPWPEIKKITTWTRYGNSVLVLRLTRRFENKEVKSAHHFISKIGNSFAGAKGRCIDPTDFDMSLDALKKILRAYANAHNSPAAKHLI